MGALRSGFHAPSLHAQLKTGDRVSKEKWSAFAIVNGETVRWVPPGVLDGIRGTDRFPHRGAPDE